MGGHTWMTRGPRVSRRAARLVLATCAMVVVAWGGAGCVPGVDANRQASATGGQERRFSELPAASATPLAGLTAGPLASADPGRPGFDPRGWKTDFSRYAVPLDEIQAAGHPRDGIPPIDRPRFESIQRADEWLKPQEPVIVLELEGVARAYPLQILLWHVIVNDTLGGVPVAVTFCVYCNSPIAFDRRVDGRTLEFSTTGNIRALDLVTYDRQTESWWQQLEGAAIVGELTGARLTVVSARFVAWSEFREAYPAGQVLSRETGFQREYGRNPFPGYDEVSRTPFLRGGGQDAEDPLDGRLPAMEQVVRVRVEGQQVAYPLSRLASARVARERVGGTPLVVFYRPGASPVSDSGKAANGAAGEGAATVFRAELDGQPLTFTWLDGAFVDVESGSRWDHSGRAQQGRHAGRVLTPLPHDVGFWFTTVASDPAVRLWSP